MRPLIDVPLMEPAFVAGAALQALNDEETGGAWVVQPNRVAALPVPEHPGAALSRAQPPRLGRRPAGAAHLADARLPLRLAGRRRVGDRVGRDAGLLLPRAVGPDRPRRHGDDAPRHGDGRRLLVDARRRRELPDRRPARRVHALVASRHAPRRGPRRAAEPPRRVLLRRALRRRRHAARVVAVHADHPAGLPRATWFTRRVCAARDSPSPAASRRRARRTTRSRGARRRGRACACGCTPSNVAGSAASAARERPFFASVLNSTRSSPSDSNACCRSRYFASVFAPVPHADGVDPRVADLDQRSAGRRVQVARVPDERRRRSSGGSPGRRTRTTRGRARGSRGR